MSYSSSAWSCPLLSSISASAPPSPASCIWLSSPPKTSDSKSISAGSDAQNPPLLTIAQCNCYRVLLPRDTLGRVSHRRDWCSSRFSSFSSRDGSLFSGRPAGCRCGGRGSYPIDLGLGLLLLSKSLCLLGSLLLCSGLGGRFIILSRPQKESGRPIIHTVKHPERNSLLHRSGLVWSYSGNLLEEHLRCHIFWTPAISIRDV